MELAMFWRADISETLSANIKQRKWLWPGAIENFRKRNLISNCNVFSWVLAYVCAQSLQSCLILCDPMKCSWSGSSVLGILQARILEGVVMLSSRGILPNQGLIPCLLSLLYSQAALYPLSQLGSPMSS